MLKLFRLSQLLPVLALTAILASCKDDDENPTTVRPQLRKTVDYAKLTDTTTYANFFVDDKGAKTVDLTTGSTLLSMFRAINTYNGTAASTGATLDATTLKNMFSNTGNPFSGTANAALNTSGVQLRNVTASSLSSADAEKERQTIEAAFGEMATASKSATATASEGQAGKLGTYLVDAKGIEWAQIIQKSLIGAFQVDYIANVLLSDKNLAADNTTLVAGKNYTQLEQNWDQIFGIITANPVYGSKATSTSSGESFIGSYMWEYNKDDFPKIHKALLTGRAAIVNNDLTTLKTQATFIRSAMEKAIAAAALGYLGKWKTAGTNTSAAAHAMGEGLGFIYSLRYAKLNNADATFSDGLLTNLVYSAPNGFWGLTNAKIDAASTAIKTKFNIP
ncbi:MULTISPECIES: DUF4856 domain-containing protein [unclassified Spirosoma]|uniref:DUF4856 domain-containing protein n=1 Tax=unclassified Spirosoma TaxID=2621999 RepID=UPI0009598984|nr:MULTISPECIES: DUF4856 domain-containing protein [unclassified Spirosoma]MBN8822242.1 DUF4856 domain-containing protein [Spirosoma sp.]OJW72445.1 MAG: DUF4856 domain-containing protein [Spirosoma sp. 48-14]